MNESPTHGPAGSARHPRCICGARGIRDPKYDAYFCPESAKWIEHVCDQACTFCKDRPPTADYARTDAEQDALVDCAALAQMMAKGDAV